MVCPRCDSARIERDGVVIRCAVCGMSYDPTRDLTAQSPEHGAALAHWLAAMSFVAEAQPILQVHAGYFSS
jgi:hypothetical protein